MKRKVKKAEQPIYDLYKVYKRQFTKERLHAGANMKKEAMTYGQFKAYMGWEAQTSSTASIRSIRATARSPIENASKRNLAMISGWKMLKRKKQATKGYR